MGSDNILQKIGKTYTTNECLFIQYNTEKSNWGCVGYTFEHECKQYQTVLPPSGFPDIAEIISLKRPEFTRNPVLLRLLDAYVAAGRLNKLTNKKRCVIVGSGPTIGDFKYGGMIDAADAYVIRLNRPADEKYFENYGRRTDLYFGCEYAKDLLEKQPNKTLISHSMITKISEYFKPGNDKWLTTGMIAILLFSRVFPEIQIFGFGMHGEDVPSELFTSINEPTPVRTHHNLKYEHELLDQMEDCDMLKRLESMSK